MLLLRPEAFARGILLRAMVPLSDPPLADLSDKRALISAGSADPIIPLGNAERLRSMLSERGAEVQLEVQNASHGLVQADLTAAKAWLAKSADL
jgi:phospholipase/carboxylesterase